MATCKVPLLVVAFLSLASGADVGPTWPSAPKYVTASEDHTCAGLESGAVCCWGRDWFGQLGSRYGRGGTALWVGNLPSAINAVAAGGDFTCSSSEAGAYCWGHINEPLLPTEDDRYDIPLQVSVPGQGPVLGVSAGMSHACVMRASSLICWGKNLAGQLGDGSHTSQVEPRAAVSGLVRPSAVAAGGSHTCAIEQGGEGIGGTGGSSVWCWGANGRGQLGIGRLSVSVPVPSVVSGLPSGATAVATGLLHSCAVVARQLWCWGDNRQGQLGTGGGTYQAGPTPVRGFPAGANVSAVSAGRSHTCAVVDHAVWCWGLNDHGQLGDGSLSNHPTPVPVKGLKTGVVTVAAGGYHSCAIWQDSGSTQIACWGSNRDGQLGDGTGIDGTGSDHPTLVLVQPPSGLGAGVVLLIVMAVLLVLGGLLAAVCAKYRLWPRVQARFEGRTALLPNDSELRGIA